MERSPRRRGLDRFLAGPEGRPSGGLVEADHVDVATAPPALPTKEGACPRSLHADRPRVSESSPKHVESPGLGHVPGRTTRSRARRGRGGIEAGGPGCGALCASARFRPRKRRRGRRVRRSPRHRCRCPPRCDGRARGAHMGSRRDRVRPLFSTRPCWTLRGDRRRPRHDGVAVPKNERSSTRSVPSQKSGAGRYFRRGRHRSSRHPVGCPSSGFMRSSNGQAALGGPGSSLGGRLPRISATPRGGRPRPHFNPSSPRLAPSPAQRVTARIRTCVRAADRNVCRPHGWDRS